LNSKQKICDRHHRKYSRSCYYCNFLNPFEPILETTYAAGTGDLDYLKELHTSQISHKWDPELNELCISESKRYKQKKITPFGVISDNYKKLIG
jgi:hypothetical protein